MAEFNPKAQVGNIPGIGNYLHVRDRIRWFRAEHPDGEIITDLAHLDPAAGYAVVKAVVGWHGGGTSVNYGSAWRDVLERKATEPGRNGQPRKGDPQAIAGDFVEFATTAAIGRALAGLGYGTDAALDWELEDFADAPIEAHAQPAQERASAPQSVTDGERVRIAATAVQGATDDQQRTIRALLPPAGITEAEMTAKMGVPTLADLPTGQAARVIERLRAQRAPQAAQGVPTAAEAAYAASPAVAARVPVPPPGGGSTVTDKQIKAIYAIGHNIGHLNENEVDARCQELYGCRPAELPKYQASQFIDVLKGEQAA